MALMQGQQMMDNEASRKTKNCLLASKVMMMMRTVNNRNNVTNQDEKNVKRDLRRVMEGRKSSAFASI